MDSICWNCQNTNEIKCPYFEEPQRIMPYMKLIDGVMIKCDKFKLIEKAKRYDSIDIAHHFKIGIGTFYRHKNYYVCKLYEEVGTYLFGKSRVICELEYKQINKYAKKGEI